MEKQYPMQEEAVLTPYIPTQHDPFIYSSWRNSLWYDQKHDQSSPTYEEEADTFYSNASKSIKSILSKEDVEIRIAVLNTNSDLILGYSVLYNKTHLVWVYVKGDYRHAGIGNLLTKGYTSHNQASTKIGKAIAEKKDAKV